MPATVVHVAAERNMFAPPPSRGRLPAVVLALAAHALLVLALGWGVQWNRRLDVSTAEAELWSAVPQAAAPRLQEAPPAPIPPAPIPPTPPAPPAPPPPPPVAEPPAPQPPDIALERERQQLAEQRKREREQAQQAAEQRRSELAEQRKRELAQRQEDERKRERAQQAAQTEQAAKLAREQELREQAAVKRLEALRQDNLRRMQGLAGATGGPGASGTATQSSGPSDSYGGRIRAKVRPNIVYSEDGAGNPATEVEVRMAPDGTITARRLTKPSGVKAWDDAVLRALDRTEVLPRDIDGRVHSPLLIEFKPRG